jgi:tRNA-specific 2-thiouridylase
VRLVRSVDLAKDQSYVLGVLTGEQLSRAMFPLGDSTKEQVRAEAARRGLAVADKPDSHDICFIADGDTRGFLQHRLGAAPGEIIDHDGQVVGRHEGSYGFTVGQRRGLGIGSPEPVSRTVRVGPAEALDVDEITAVRPVWSGPAPDGVIEATVQLRAHGETFPATCWLEAGSLRIRLHARARGVARGQAAVLYDGDAVLGSGTISATALAA